MEERQTLKPCPFCGSISVDIMEHITRQGWPTIYSVECRGCDCSTDAYDSREKAVNAWNIRANRTLTAKSILTIIDSAIEGALETQSQLEFSYLCGYCNGLLVWLSCTQDYSLEYKLKKILQTRVNERSDLEKLQSLIQSILTNG